MKLIHKKPRKIDSFWLSAHVNENKSQISAYVNASLLPRDARRMAEWLIRFADWAEEKKAAR